MAKTITINGKQFSLTVVHSKDQTKFISENDAEMDRRGKAAVKAAIEKAQVCGKPIARYDSVAKRAYLEYPNGEKKYAE